MEGEGGVPSLPKLVTQAEFSYTGSQSACACDVREGKIS